MYYSLDCFIFSPVDERGIESDSLRRLLRNMLKAAGDKIVNLRKARKHSVIGLFLVSIGSLSEKGRYH